MFDVLKPTYGPAHLVLFLAWLLAVLGLPGFYARQAQRAGVLGLIGFVLTITAAAYHLSCCSTKPAPRPC